MYFDYYLKFKNEEEFRTFETSQYNVDILGNLSTEDRVVDGWHVNVRSELDLQEDLKQFEISTPIHPKRIWLGD